MPSRPIALIWVITFSICSSRPGRPSRALSIGAVSSYAATVKPCVANSSLLWVSAASPHGSSPASAAT